MKSAHLQYIINIINDKKLHEVYELHYKYRLTPFEAREAINKLYDMGVIVVNGNFFMMSREISNDQLKSLYISLKNRNFQLDEEEIQIFKSRAINQNSLYLPKLVDIDKNLTV